MKKLLISLLIVIMLVAVLATTLVACSSDGVKGSEKVTDMVGRKVPITPGSYSRVVCIGAGALRLYSYVGDVSLICAVEDIDNTTRQTRPKMFDGVSRPYQMAYADVFNELEASCGVGGPQAQEAEAEKILACNPDIIISEYEDAEKAKALQKKLRVPVIVVKYGAAGIFDENIAKSLTLLGHIFNKEERATELVNYINTEKAAIEERVKNVEVASQKKVYICGLGNWGTTNELMTAQNYAPFNVAKINNIVTDLSKDGIQAIEAEKFMDLAPDMDIIILDAAAVKNIKDPEYKEARLGRLQSTKAWANGEVYLEMAYNAYYTNVEIALINTWYAAKVVYPDLFTDINIETKTTEVTTKFLGKDLNEAIKAKPQSFGGYKKIDTATFFG